jgi:hypothetical protein
MAGAPTLFHSAGGTAPIVDMAMSGNRIFYGINRPNLVEIRAVNKDGTTPAVLATVSVAASALQAITATTTAVYFVVSNTLYSVPVGGGSMQTLGAVGSSAPSPTGGRPTLVSDGTLLFYAHLDLQTSGLQAFNLGGTPVATLSGLYPTTLVLDGDTILSSAVVLGGVHRVAKTLDPSSVTSVMPGSEMTGFSVAGIVHDTTSIYVLGASGGGAATGLWRKPKAGGAAQPVLPPGSLDGSSCALVLAEPFLYFVESPIEEATNENPNPVVGQPVLGRIDRRATNGVATGIAHANAFTVLQDANFVYFSSGTSIRRLPR